MHSEICNKSTDWVFFQREKYSLKLKLIGLVNIGRLGTRERFQVLSTPQLQELEIMSIILKIKFPFKRKACQVYRVKYGRVRIW